MGDGHTFINYVRSSNIDGQYGFKTNFIYVRKINNTIDFVT